MSDAQDTAGHICRIQPRSYELDSFGHVNHAVFLNYFEYARFQTLSDGGFPPQRLEERNEGVHVVRVEVDYRKEVRLESEIEIRTAAIDAGSSSMTIGQRMVDASDGQALFAEARVVLVWIGPDRRPMRIPADVREAFGLPERRS